jgi:hypothetical protein
MISDIKQCNFFSLFFSFTSHGMPWEKILCALLDLLYIFLFSFLSHFFLLKWWQQNHCIVVYRWFRIGFLLCIVEGILSWNGLVCRAFTCLICTNFRIILIRLSESSQRRRQDCLDYLKIFEPYSLCGSDFLRGYKPFGLRHWV